MSGITVDGLQYHIRCKAGDVGRYVLMPGDPVESTDRTILREHVEVSYNREYRTYTGTIDGVPVSVCSTNWLSFNRHCH